MPRPSDEPIRKRVPYAIHDARDRPISPEQMGGVFARSGIRRPTDDLARLAKMISHANLMAGAWVEDSLVGVARALTDFSYCCYLSDLAVDRAYQRMGIGKALIEFVKSQLSDEVTIILLSAPAAKDYYKPLGFEWADNAWRLPRRK
ncbi:MAG: GNAT family N-acetyltransferase [Tepidisphaeraceae bacterium]|jgi:ribosomal protein S18 acetylase RimI-like enzyme